MIAIHELGKPDILRILYAQNSLCRKQKDRGSFRLDFLAVLGLEQDATVPFSAISPYLTVLFVQYKWDSAQLVDESGYLLRFISANGNYIQIQHLAIAFRILHIAL